MSMKDRDRERFLARQEELKREREAKKPRRSRVASPEEQRARYLDCGPLAWDDRDNPDY